MENYVCILIGPNRQIVTVDAFPAESDSDAQHYAQQLLERREGATHFELWQRGRKVAVRALDAPTHSS